MRRTWHPRSRNTKATFGGFVVCQLIGASQAYIVLRLSVCSKKSFIRQHFETVVASKEARRVGGPLGKNFLSLLRGGGVGLAARREACDHLTSLVGAEMPNSGAPPPLSFVVVFQHLAVTWWFQLSAIRWTPVCGNYRLLWWKSEQLDAICQSCKVDQGSKFGCLSGIIFFIFFVFLRLCLCAHCIALYNTVWLVAVG